MRAIDGYYGHGRPWVSRGLQAGEQRFNQWRRIGWYVRAPRPGIDRHDQQFGRCRLSPRIRHGSGELPSWRDSRTHEKNDAQVALAVLRNPCSEVPSVSQSRAVDMRNEPADHPRGKFQTPERGLGDAGHLESV